MLNKKIFYGCIFVVFLGLCSVYLWLTIYTTDNFYQHYLLEAVKTSETQIQRYFKYKAQSLIAEYVSYDADQIKTPEQMKKLVFESHDGQAEEKLYFADFSGQIYLNNGKPSNKTLDSGILRTVHTDGYAMAYLAELGNNRQRMVLIVPFGNSRFYIMQAYPIENFVSILADNMVLKTKTITLFDELSKPVDILSQESLFTSADTDSSQSLRDGGSDFTLHPIQNTLQKKGFRQYNVFLHLEQPKGWFFGTHVDYSLDKTYSFGLVSSSAVMFALWILIVLVIIFLDIVNDREKEKELFLVGSTDQLTGLINNSGLKESVIHFMERKDLCGYNFVYMDIVAFNRINAMFGYSVGDMLLRIVSSVIRDNCECGARINADCFVFFVRTVENVSAYIEDLLGERINKELGKEYLQMISFKFGVFPLNQGKYSFLQIYDGALLALKNAKKMYKKSEVIYDSELKKSMDLRKNIEINMLHALSKEEFIPYIQPQFSSNDEKCCGGETLIRWQSESMGLISPDDFIPLFESNGFIVETDFFMLTCALNLLQEIINQGRPPITLAVNQSKVTISFPNYFERLKNLIALYDIPLEYIELEVTESTLENDLEIIVPLMYSLKELGFTIAMDDFGSGFSSLNTLRVLPIDVLKIDKAFLQESDTSQRSKSIIVNIINMAKELRIKVICEGVETAGQLEFLKNAGCDIIQGYYFSKPIPLIDFENRYLKIGTVCTL